MSFEELLTQFDTLWPAFSAKLTEVAKVAKQLLDKDYRRAEVEFRKRGIPISTLLRLELVAIGNIDPRVFADGTVKGKLVELLPVEEQRFLCDQGYECIVGGTVQEPIKGIVKFAEMTDVQARLMIDPTTRKRRTIEQQAKIRNKTMSRKLPFTVENGWIIIHKTKWQPDELRGLIAGLKMHIPKDKKDKAEVEEAA